MHSQQQLRSSPEVARKLSTLNGFKSEAFGMAVLNPIPKQSSSVKVKMLSVETRPFSTFHTVGRVHHVGFSVKKKNTISSVTIADPWQQSCLLLECTPTPPSRNFLMSALCAFPSGGFPQSRVPSWCPCHEITGCRVWRISAPMPCIVARSYGTSRIIPL